MDTNTEALLGTMPDRLLAEAIGSTPGSVYFRRRKLGIAAFPGSGQRQAAWTPEMDLLLGTNTDKRVAELLNVSPSAVQLRRATLNVPAFGPGSNNKQIVWTREMDDLLGSNIDREIAAQLGLSRKTVKDRRLSLGITSYRIANRIIPLGLIGIDKESKRIYQEKRRHAQEGLEDTLTNEEWAAARRWFDGCAYCHSEEGIEEDHVVPVSKRGARTAVNIVPACSSCNSSKRDKDLKSWALRHFGAAKGEEIVAEIKQYFLVANSTVGGSAP